MGPPSATERPARAWFSFIRRWAAAGSRLPCFGCAWPPAALFNVLLRRQSSAEQFSGNVSALYPPAPLISSMSATYPAGLGGNSCASVSGDHTTCRQLNGGCPSGIDRVKKLRVHSAERRLNPMLKAWKSPVEREMEPPSARRERAVSLPHRTQNGECCRRQLRREWISHQLRMRDEIAPGRRVSLF
jgi:hypothetical protein